MGPNRVESTITLETLTWSGSVDRGWRLKCGQLNHSTNQLSTVVRPKNSLSPCKQGDSLRALPSVCQS